MSVISYFKKSLHEYVNDVLMFGFEVWDIDDIRILSAPQHEAISNGNAKDCEYYITFKWLKLMRKRLVIPNDVVSEVLENAPINELRNMREFSLGLNRALKSACYMDFLATLITLIIITACVLVPIYFSMLNCKGRYNELNNYCYVMRDFECRVKALSIDNVPDGKTRLYVSGEYGTFEWLVSSTVEYVYSKYAKTDDHMVASKVYDIGYTGTCSIDDALNPDSFVFDDCRNCHCNSIIECHKFVNDMNKYGWAIMGFSFVVSIILIVVLSFVHRFNKKRYERAIENVTELWGNSMFSFMRPIVVVAHNPNQVCKIFNKRVNFPINATAPELNVI